MDPYEMWCELCGIFDTTESRRWYDLARKYERDACAGIARMVAREIDDTNSLATYIAKTIEARK